MNSAFKQMENITNFLTTCKGVCLFWRHVPCSVHSLILTHSLTHHPRHSTCLFWRCSLFRTFTHTHSLTHSLTTHTIPHVCFSVMFLVPYIHSYSPTQHPHHPTFMLLSQTLLFLQIGLAASERFETVDLFDNKNMQPVLMCLSVLKDTSQNLSPEQMTGIGLFFHPVHSFNLSFHRFVLGK